MRTLCNVWQAFLSAPIAFYLFNCVRDGYVTWEEEQYMHMVINTNNPYDLAACSVYKLADIAMYTLNDCAMS